MRALRRSIVGSETLLPSELCSKVVFRQTCRRVSTCLHCPKCIYKTRFSGLIFTVSSKNVPMRGSDTHRQFVQEEDEEDQRSSAQGRYESDEQQNYEEEPNDDQRAVTGEDTRQTESDGEEYEANPPSPGQLSRTQSDPTPMPTEEDRDRVSSSQ